ncbi:MAG TPA: hypothetical protein VLN59_10960 [Burkholderiales bacterium]|nr:hypothetical protein [Burkholderiales bacterium]
MTPIPSRLLVAALAACSLSVIILADTHAAADAPGQSATPAAPALQPWQKRRLEFAETVKRVRADDASARKDFEAVLTEFEKQPFSRTPMENMEILGVFYVPQEGIEVTLPAVVANAALGWYDALRFTSESGRDEIVKQEGFFRKAYVVAGTEMSQRAVKFFGDNPDLAAALVAKGIAVADRLRDDPRYDHKWPSAYGEEARACAKDPQCPGLYSMPDTRWLDAWEDAKQRVISYYRLNNPGARGSDSPRRP